ncbi:MAG: WbqC family protein [Flavobacteriaceae bacterium]
MILVHPTYFPSVSHMIAITKAKEIIFEIEDNYQKQTYRNRVYIAHSNGKLSLNVPVKHSKNGERQKTKEVCIENSFPWQSQHWKSLQTAYRTSPFFEYYEDDLEPLFKDSVENLLELNLKIFEVLCEIMEIPCRFSFSNEYIKNPKEKDLRYLVEAKTEPDFPFTPYQQVLQEKHGFLPNLSVLDLLFNEGPNAVHYLENQVIDFSLPS